jgi:hypothetical protein
MASATVGTLRVMLTANTAEFEAAADRSAAAVGRLVKGFQSDKAIQAGQNMVAAVEKIGGALKLTESEQRRVNVTLDAAIQKYAALGQQAPADMLKLRDATAQADQASSKLATGFGKLNGLLGAFGVAVSVGAIVSFGKGLFDAASNIKDTATKLDISTDAVQGFKFAAEQTGGSLDSVGTAINKMNMNLAGGDKATVQALKDAGLRFSDIRAMKPEDAFLAIADAIQKIPDPMTQSDVAMQLFGKGAADLLPGIKEGFRGLADSVDKMSADTIKALDDAQDAWDRLGTKVTIVSGNIIADSMNMVEGSLGSWRKFGLFVDNISKMGVGGALALADAMETANRAAERHGDINLSLPPKIRKTADELAAERKELERLESEHNKAIAVIANATKQGEEAWFKFQNASTKAVLDMTEAIQKKGLPAILDMNHAILTGLPQITEGIDNLASQLGLKWHEGITTNALPQMKRTWTMALAEIMNIRPEKGQFDVGFGQIMEGIAGDFARLTGAGGFKSGIKNFASGFAKDFTGAILGGIPGIGPILSQFAGPLVDGVKKLFGGLFKGNDARKMFQDAFGDLDKFHTELLALGDAGEQFWIRMTQRTGKDDTAGAAALIEEINTALDRQKQKEAETAAATTAAETEKTAARQAAVDAAKAQVSKLDSEIKSLQDSIAGEAPEEFMGVVEQQTRARIAALEAERDVAALSVQMAEDNLTESLNRVADAIELIPTDIEIQVRTKYEGGGVTPPIPGGAVPSFAEGSGGFLDFGAGTLAMLHGRERVLTAGESGGQAIYLTVVSQLDGREVGRNQIQYIPAELSRVGVRR